jgi:hypothetical protein
MKRLFWQLCQLPTFFPRTSFQIFSEFYSIYFLSFLLQSRANFSPEHFDSSFVFMKNLNREASENSKGRLSISRFRVQWLLLLLWIPHRLRTGLDRWAPHHGSRVEEGELLIGHAVCMRVVVWSYVSNVFVLQWVRFQKPGANPPTFEFTATMPAL